MCTFTCTCPKNVHGGKKKSSVLLDSGARRNDDSVTKNDLNEPNKPNQLNQFNKPNQPNQPNQPAPISFDRGRYKMR